MRREGDQMTNQEPTGDFVVVWRAATDAEAQGVLGLLRRADLSPLVLGPENIDATVAYASGSTASIEIAVPAEEEKQARESLLRREEQLAPAVQAHARLFSLQFLLATGIALASLPVLWLWFESLNALAMALPLWLIAFLAMGLHPAFKSPTGGPPDEPDDDQM